MSCSSNGNKNCYQKSCVRYYNNNPQAFDPGSTLQLQIEGAKVVDSGISIEAAPLSFSTVKAGLYHIAADIVADVTTLGTGIFQVYMDGVPLPCTIKNVSLPLGNTSVHTETDLQLSGCCCNIEHTFTFMFTPTLAEGSIIEFCAGITKLA